MANFNGLPLSIDSVAFTNGDEEVSNGLLKKALLYTKPFAGIIISHPSDKSLEHGGAVHESSVMVNTGLKMSHSISEYLRLNEQLEVAKYCNAKIHLSCISTAESVEIVRKAKDAGQQVTCDVSILNLCFTDEELLAIVGGAKVSDKILIIQNLLNIEGQTYVDYLEQTYIQNGVKYDESLDNPTSLDDFFYQNQKIYVVVAILVIIFLLLVGYLIRLDQKISKLEKNQNET